MSADETKEILKKAYLRIQQLEKQLEASNNTYEPIAIVGGALRFAGANTPDELFSLLLDGANLVSDFPVNRWSVSNWVSDKQESGKAYSFAASYLENIELFDSQFFNIPPEECQHTDPQQRLLLETTIEALQSAGMPLANIAGSKTSVFIGTVNSGYDELIASSPTEYSPTGSIVASASGKISYKLNLKGPALSIDTACSSSLTAIHLGCKSIQSGESEVAIAGGVNLILTPRGHIGFSQLGAMTTDGKAKVFDKSADGFSRGEGCGIVVLKKLKDAQRDGNTILGVIRGSAMGQDGLSNGYTAPSQQSQEEVIKEALKLSGLQPSEIGYIEAHGTGTSLGDSIELQALHKIFGTQNNHVFLGSVKANLGHAEYAAGMASIFKTIHVLQSKTVPPQLHIQELNPNFNWDKSQLKVSKEIVELPTLQYAGISGFGISGTNVHLVLEGYCNKDSKQLQLSGKTLYVSARTEAALYSLIQKHIKAINLLEDAALDSYIVSNNIHRDHFEYRLAIHGVDRSDILNVLNTKLTEGQNNVEQTRPGRGCKIVFVFPGQGSQWNGMASELYKNNVSFRNSIHAIENAINQYAELPVSAWIENGSEEYLQNERTTQPVLFAIQIALAELWISQGIKPDVLFGLSMGEVSAMYIAGIITLDNAAKIICRRSELLVSGISGYEMCIAEYADEKLDKILQDFVGMEISGYYSASTHLLSGPADVMQDFLAFAEAEGIYVKKVRTSVATHCSAVNGIMHLLETGLQEIDYKAMQIPVYSSAYNRFLEEGDLNTGYWLENLRKPILFNQSVTSLEDQGYTSFVEISAHPLTGNYLRQVLQDGYIYQPTLLRDHNCNEVFFQSLDLLYKAGVTPIFNEKSKVHPLLPLYPWDKKAFPIPYNNYGITGSGVASKKDLTLLMPEWNKSDEIITTVSHRHIVYCSFSNAPALSGYNNRYDWDAEKEALLTDVTQNQSPIVIIDVAFAENIEQVSDVLDALKAIAARIGNTPADVVLLAFNTFPVTRSENSINPAGYAWLGIVRSLQTEWEFINIHWVDTDASLHAERLLAFVANNKNGGSAIFRNNEKYLQVVHQHTHLAVPSSEINSVLIIGGTADMGLMIAEWYAEKSVSAIILNGRRPVADESEWDDIIDKNTDKRTLAIIKTVRKLRASGIQVIIATGDICDAAVVGQLRDVAFAHGVDCVDDIVFVAGTSLPHIFLENSTSAFIAEANTRITGWKNLVAENGIAFRRFVFMSSASGFFRSASQAPYLFANHWIDAYATKGDSKGRKYTAILWPIWKEVGLALEQEFLPDTLLEHGLNSDLKEYFNAIIDSKNLPPVVIAARPASNDLTHLWKQVPFIPGRGLKEWIQKQELIQKHDVQDNRQVVENDELSVLLKGLWTELLGRNTIHPQDHFFQVGGNSVLLIKLVNRIKSRYPGIDIRLPDLIKNLGFQQQHTLVQQHIDLIGSNNRIVIEKAIAASFYPASDEQKQIWIQSQLDEDASLYNLTGVYAYEGVLDTDAFIKAVNHIAAEQEIFRTRYVLEDGVIMQAVDESAVVPIGIYTFYSDDELDKAAGDFFVKEAAYRFDLSIEHPFRLKVLHAENKGVFVLNLHHIASDGWALGYYTSRLSEVYKKYCNDGRAELLSPELTYKDYSVFQQGYLSSAQGEVDSLFWKDILAGDIANLYLPIDGARPAVFEFHGKKVKCFIDEEQSSKVSVFVEKTGISLYAFLQSLLSTYLSVVSGERKIITGTPMSSRVDEKLETVVGNFVNILPLCIEVDKAKSFAAIASATQSIIGDVLLHQLYPFNRIVQDLKIKRDPSRHPVFDILFVLQNHTEANLQLEGLEITRKIIDPEHSKLDLFIEARESNGLIEFNFEYNDRLFHESTIAGFWKGLQRFLFAILDNPDEPIGNLQLIKEENGSTIDGKFTNAAHPFLKQAKMQPGCVAITSGHISITYKELEETSKRLASDLQQIKQRVKNVEFPSVAVACGRSVEQVISMLGVWQAEMVYMPVNPEQSLTHMLRQLLMPSCNILICTKTDWEEYKKSAVADTIDYVICFTGITQWEVHNIRGIKTLADMPVLQQATIVRKNAAYIVFTSGSTGVPKAILGRHDSLIHFIRWQSEAFNIADVDTSWLIQPTFDASFRDVLLPLYNGGTLHIPAGETWELMSALVKWIDNKRINVIHTVPSVFRLLLGEIEAGFKGISLFDHLEYIFLSGEPLYKNDVVRWQTIFGNKNQLVNFYGSSETTLIRTSYIVPVSTSLIGNLVPVGVPMIDTTVYLSNNEELCKPGEIGKIYIETKYPSLGYLIQDGAVVSPLIPNFVTGTNVSLYDTGDIGYIDEKGLLVVTGRSDDQVKVHGIRLHTGVVETAISEIQNFEQIAVVYDEEAGTLKAYYNTTGQPDIGLVREYISQKLSSQHVPDIWIPLSVFPLTTHGKVDRVLLKSMQKTAPEDGANVQALVSDTEQVLGKLWCNILKCSVVGRNSNFFNLGGNSLNGLVLLSRIHKELKRKISLRALFANPVLSDMAIGVDAAPLEGLEAITIQPEAEWYPVSHAQRRMWILHNMEENSITYNIKRAYEISGDVDVEILNTAFRLLVDNQESLRTNFKVVGGVPVQFVRDAENALFVLEQIDLADEENAEAVVRGLANEEVQYNFNLEIESLLRARFIRLSELRCVLLVNMHHIISDGWSMELLMRNLFESYEQIRTGHKVSPKTLPVQYKDYTCWQHHKTDTNAYEKERQYWLQQLSGDIPILELPADNARAKIKTYEGQPMYFRLDARVKTRIEELCKKNDVSLFMFLLASVKVLLHKYTGQKDMIIGSPVAGRAHPDLNGIVGFFVNMLALRSEISTDTTFTEYLQSLRKKTMDAFEYQSYPFDKLVEELPLQRNTSRSPLFDITVQVLNVEFWESDTFNSGFKVKPFIADWQRSQFDLSFFFKEENNSIFSLIEFNNTIYHPERIERLISHFNVLLGSILDAPETVINGLNYLPRHEHRQLMYNAVAATECELPYSTVLDAINANSIPTNIAVKGLQHQLRFSELETLSNKLAGCLLKYVHAKQPVAVLTNDRPWLITAMLGIMKSGNSYMPLDPAHPSERLKYMLNDAGIEVLVITKHYIPLADKLLWECEKLKGYICVDSNEIHSWVPADAELMRKDLWNYVGKNAKDQIEAGGWISSYTGLPFSPIEMEEYAENALQKIMPFLGSSTRVLELGCSSGLTLFKVAPLVASYTGIDLSEEILNITRRKVAEAGLENVSLHTLYADAVDTLSESEFDVIIINSVIQSFGSYNYFRRVLSQVIDKANRKAVLFLGDVQDIARKDALIASLTDFSIVNQGKGYRTKITWDDELFFHQDFLRDLSFEFPVLSSFDFSDKNGTIRNELSLFRFDAIIHINKDEANPNTNIREKWQIGIDNVLNNKYAPQLPVVNATDCAYVIYTSGTSGYPKGVVVSHAALVNQVFGMAHCFDNKIGCTDNVLMCCRGTFDVSVLEMFIALTHGASLVEIDMSQPIGPVYLTNILASQNVTWAYLPPSLLDDIATEVKDRSINLSLDKLLVGVEPIKSTTLLRFSEACPGITIVNGYGPTETTIVATTYRYALGSTYSIVPIGIPMPGYKIMILDDNADMTGVGIPGEIVIAGTGVANGYLNNEALTKQKFRFLNDGQLAYYTGDIGVWDAKGNMSFVGRKDRQIKFNGYRIELPEIEAALSGFPGVVQAIVFILSLGDNVKQMVAFAKSGEAIEELELKHYLANKLPEFMLPQRIISLKEWPLTTHGKVDYRQLENLVHAPGRKQLANDKPETRTETILLELYRSLLKQTDIAVTDNFFDLGGHSLIATRLVTRAAKEYGLTVPLVNVFIHPTVRELANSVSYEEVHDIQKVAEQPDGLYPLSYAQNRLWIIDHLNPDDSIVRAAYNMVGLFEVNGVFNKEELEQAIYLVIHNHEILRTNFVSEDGKAYQKVNDKVVFSIEETQIPTNEKNVESYIRKQSEKIAALPFDLERDVLLRCTYYKGSNRAFIIVVMHHIISDGWSMDVFSKEIKKALAHLRGENQYSAPCIQYKDYANWNKKIVEGDIAAKQYWHNLLCERESPTVIPSASTRPRWRTFNGDTLLFSFDEDTAKDIKQFCTTKQVTLYSFLVSALNVWIHKYTGLNSITIGSPVSGRSHTMLENQLGFYLNNIAVRTAPKGTQEFGVFLSDVHTQVLQALRYQEYPFDKLVDDLLTERDTAHSPFFDIYLALQNNEMPQVDFGNFSFVPLSFDRKVSRYDLNFMFAEDNGLKLQLQYNTDLYTPEVIKTFWQHLKNIISGVVKAETTTIAQIEMLEEADLKTLLSPPVAKAVFANGHPLMEVPAQEGTDTITFHFDKQVKKFPENIAVSDQGIDLTYRELDNAAANLASALIAKGAKRGDVVALHIDRNIHRVISILAVLKTGAAYLPLDNGLPHARLSLLSKDSSAILLLTDTVSTGNWFEGDILACAINTSASVTSNLPLLSGEDNAYIIYTSGTTGVPKGVVVTHANVISLMKETNLYDFSEHDVWTLFHQYNFDFSVWEIWGALLFGGKLVIVPAEISKDLNAFAELVIVEKVTVLNQTPPVFYLVSEILLTKQSGELASLRYIIFGGDTLRPSMLQLFAKKCPWVKLVNMYGITETTVHVTLKLLEEKDLLLNHSNIGKAIPTLSVYILDEYMQLVPYGMPGQLAIAGKGLSKGYLNDHVLTKKKFFYHPIIKQLVYLSGDLAGFLPDGDIEYLGRIDQQVKIRGHRIEPAEIEYVLQNTQHVEKAAVLKSGEAETSHLSAFITPSVIWKDNFDKLEEVIGSYADEVACTRLENDMPFFHKNESETRFMYREIVTDDGYMLQNLQLKDSPVIIDAGANIGMFSLLATSLWENAVIYAFEPMPEIFKCLAANAALHAPGRLIVFNEGLSEMSGQAELHYYAMNTVMSGGGANDKELLKDYIRSRYVGQEAESEEMISAVVDETLDAVSVICKMSTVSDIIETQGLHYVDLIKIDVEEWEQKLINGIREKHWDIIGNIIAEVHDIDDRVTNFSAFLSVKGFNVETQQTDMLKGVALYNIKASRSIINGAIPKTKTRYIDFTSSHSEWLTSNKLRQAVKAEAIAILPPYMVPDKFILVDELPLTPNGKLDRKKLLGYEIERLEGVEEEIHLSDRAQQLIEILSEVLHKSANPSDNFFEAGGNSLNATQVVNRVRSRMGVDLKVRDIFERPVLKDLAAYIDALQGNTLPGINLAKEAQHYPLADAQQRILTTTLIEGIGSVAYNMTGGLLINGNLDVGVMQQAFDILLQRHEILRTKFIGANSEFVQVPVMDAKLIVECRDTAELNETICRELILTEAAVPFNLQHAPLLRCLLYQSGESNLFIVSMHHIISDGWSMGIMTNEIITIYNAIKQKKEIELPVLKCQYKDYAAWLTGLMNNTTWANTEKRFWQQELQDYTPLELPYDFAQGASQSYAGAGITTYTDSWQQLRARLKESGVSPYAFLLSLINVLFTKITGQHDVIVGTPVAGRPLLALEQQIGFYVNTLPVRMDTASLQTFEEVLAKAKLKSIDIFEHQLYPFNNIVEDVGGLRDMGHSPLFNVLLVWQDIQITSYELDGVTARRIDTNFDSTILDMSLIFSEVDGMLKMTLQYNTDLFLKETAEAVTVMLNNIISAVAADFSIALDEIEL